MDSATQALCKQLFDEGVKAVSSGDKTTGIARFDEVIARCTPPSEPWMPAIVAGAMFNKATCYRFASDTDQAVAAFDQVVARFAQDPELASRRYVAMALYNKGVALQGAHRPAPAIQAFDAAISHCGLDEDPVIRERVALSLYCKVECLTASDPDANVAPVLLELLDRFEPAPEPNIQRIVGQILLTYPRLLSFLRPAAHAATLPANLDQWQEIERIEREDPEHAEVAAEYKKHLADLVAGDIAAAAESHAAAIAVLDAYWTNQKPFALFLRSFDLEASQVKLAPTRGTIVPVRSIDMEYSKVEDTLIRMLNHRIPAMGIWNPQAIEAPAVQRSIPKLEVRNAYWENVLRVLLQLASLIVMRMDTLTAGVQTELNAIREAGKAESTIVILPDPAHADEHSLAEAVAAFANQEYAASVVKKPIPTADELAGFAVVVAENELQSPPTRAAIDRLIAKTIADTSPQP